MLILALSTPRPSAWNALIALPILLEIGLTDFDGDGRDDLLFGLVEDTNMKVARV